MLTSFPKKIFSHELYCTSSDAHVSNKVSKYPRFSLDGQFKVRLANVKANWFSDIYLFVCGCSVQCRQRNQTASVLNRRLNVFFLFVVICWFFLNFTDDISTTMRRNTIHNYKITINIIAFVSWPRL